MTLLTTGLNAKRVFKNELTDLDKFGDLSFLEEMHKIIRAYEKELFHGLITLKLCIRIYNPRIPFFQQSPNAEKDVACAIFKKLHVCMLFGKIIFHACPYAMHCQFWFYSSLAHI